MKKQGLTTALLLVFLFAAQAQSRLQKNNFAAGGGLEWYKGDLGNSFFDLREEWYGFARLSFSRYLNRSLDAQAFASMGEIGRCFEGVQDPEHRVLMLRSRFTTAGLQLKYKFANGYLLRETSWFAPFVLAGAAMNFHNDIWTNDPRVNEGYYAAMQGGAGLAIQLTKCLNFVYDLQLGYLTNDRLDFISKGGNDTYLQNNFSLGYSF